MLVERERRALRNYFGKSFNISNPGCPPSTIKGLEQIGLGFHFLPGISYEDFPPGALSEFFLKLIQKNQLKSCFLDLNQGWILVEEEPKHFKERVWLYKNLLFDLIKGVGINPRGLIRLSPELSFRGWNKFKQREGITREEIDNNILPEIEKRKPFKGKPRLPRYLEYVYLGSNFYHNWGQTRTWEWLEDELKDGRGLAAGYRQASTLGADPFDYWSTILGYRLILDVKETKQSQNG